MLALIKIMPLLGFFVIRILGKLCFFFCKGVKSNLYSAMILFYLLVHLETFNEVTKKVLIDGIKRGGLALAIDGENHASVNDKDGDKAIMVLQ